MTAHPGWSAEHTLYPSKAVYRGANLASQGGGASAATGSAVTPQQYGAFASARSPACARCVFLCYQGDIWRCWQCLRAYHC
jgi:hypothetical protein